MNSSIIMMSTAELGVLTVGKGGLDPVSHGCTLKYDVDVTLKYVKVLVL